MSMEIVEGRKIAVVDVSVYSLDRKDDPTDAELSGVVADIKEALKTCNAFFIKGIGVDQDMLARLIKKGTEFYKLPVETKNKYIHDQTETWPLHVGYLPELTVDNEKVAEKTGREAFHYSPLSGLDFWPKNDVVDGLIPTFDEFFEQMNNILYRMLDCMSLVLGLKRSYLVDNYFSGVKAGKVCEGLSLARINEYPVLGKKLDKGSMRFAAHADYTILTLLHITEQGLFSELPEGGWIPVNPQPGCILVQAGWGMDSITNGKIKQNRHCVIAPWSDEAAGKPRHSLVLFGLQDYHSYLTTIPALTDEGEEKKNTDPRLYGVVLDEVMKGYRAGFPDNYNATTQGV